MSTGSVLEQTLERARRAGLRCHVLPAHHDVDTRADVERLSRAKGFAQAPRTACWLREFTRR